MSVVDAVLLIAFGGPTAPDEIRPFLERVSRGRRISPERLEEVAHHYERMPGGRSPLNELTERQAVGLRQALARAVAATVGVEPWSLAYQSRSGGPDDPWLEPDIGHAVQQLAAAGARHLVVMPLGFVCDHVEVLYDLDIEARALAAGNGLAFHRASAVNDHPQFIAMLADLVQRACG